jgi:hypothetical protein
MNGVFDDSGRPRPLKVFARLRYYEENVHLDTKLGRDHAEQPNAQPRVIPRIELLKHILFLYTARDYIWFYRCSIILVLSLISHQVERAEILSL